MENMRGLYDAVLTLAIATPQFCERLACLRGCPRYICARRATMIRTFTWPALGVALSILIPAAAGAADCSGNPAGLGTARVLTVDPATTPAVGRKHFRATLPLQPKEVVLTFDDGPFPGTTDAILDALAAECVHATFFVLGEHAAASPELLRRELRDGHTVGHHTFDHPLPD